MKNYLHPFDPIIDNNSKVLILGSFPSFDSFKYSFYYANKNNAFWKIIEHIYEVKLNSTNDKIKLLTKKHIALWDVVKSCKRDSSLDSRLRDIKLNDIEKLLKDYPNIDKIGCNGKKSYELFKKNFKTDKEVVYLPSTSSANARMKFDEKLKIYKEFLYG